MITICVSIFEKNDFCSINTIEMENTIQVIYPHTSMHGHLQLSADIAPKMTKDRIIIDSMGNYIKLCITSDEIPQNRGMVIVVRFMVAKEHDFGTELLWTVVDQGSDPHRRRPAAAITVGIVH